MPLYQAALRRYEAETERLERVSAREAAAASAAAREAAAALLDAVDADVSQSFELEREIGKELRALRAGADRLAARGAVWAAALEKADDALRGFGDAETFLEATVREVQGAEAVLVAAAEREGAASTELSDAALDALLDAVAGAVAASPGPLRRCRSRLAADAAAVVAGARPGAMLDYAPGLTSAAAAGLAAAVSAATGERVVAAHLDGCCFLLGSTPVGPSEAPSSELVASNGAQQPDGGRLRRFPWPVALAPGVPPAWAPEGRCRQLSAALDAIAAALEQDVAAPGSMAHPVPAAADRVRAPADRGHSAVDLAPVVADVAARFAVALPAINAWLLGYPVAYDVAPDPDRAAAAAAAASLSGAVIFSLTVRAPRVAAALARRGWPPPAASGGRMGAGDDVELCSFSLPAALAVGAGEWEAPWLAQVGAAVRPPFGRPRLAVRPTAACLVL